MEEKPSKVSLKSSDRHDSDKESVHSDIRDLWTTTTLSQAQLNMPLSEVCEGFDAEGRSISKTRGWYSPGSRSLDEGDKASHKPEEMDEHALVELELHRGSSMEIIPGEDTASQIEAEKSSSMSSLNIAKHTPHRAYWAEQQSRLPLPLMELMENEALEILTKALRSELPTNPQELPRQILATS
ncbi:cation channel sperm-associated auxiliary subunit zeta isoform X2 [Macaca nemestrina]|uniref:cation channel sperm-associated auxiliary subunit zeta isoform X2 n=1 Tax=Macaca nemestrina TaxID=9545 RepID=UPI0005F4EA04